MEFIKKWWWVLPLLVGLVLVYVFTQGKVDPGNEYVRARELQQRAARKRVSAAEALRRSRDAKLQESQQLEQLRLANILRQEAEDLAGNSPEHLTRYLLRVLAKSKSG